MRALAFKWMRILYRCWQDRKPYSEELHLTRLANRRNAQMQKLARAVQILWMASACAVKKTC